MARRPLRTEEKIRLIRYASIGFVALFVVLVAIVGIYYGTAVDVGGEAARRTPTTVWSRARARVVPERWK